MPAAHGVALDAQRAIELRAVHPALSANTLRAPPEISLPMTTPPWPSFIAQLRIDDVLHRDVHPPPVLVASRLERDAVIAGVEGAALDQHVLARLRVAAVVVGPVRGDRHVADRDARAQHRVDLPHRRIHDPDPFDQDVPAAVRLDEVGAQEVPVAEHALRHRGTPWPASSISRVRAAVCFAVAAAPVLALSSTSDRVSLAVERAGAGHRDVLAASNA